MEFFTIILPLALNDYNTVERCIKCISSIDIVLAAIVLYCFKKFLGRTSLTLLHSERPKSYTILAFLSAVGLMKQLENISIKVQQLTDSK